MERIIHSPRILDHLYNTDIPQIAMGELLKIPVPALETQLLTLGERDSSLTLQ